MVFNLGFRVRLHHLISYFHFNKSGCILKCKDNFIFYFHKILYVHVRGIELSLELVSFKCWNDVNYSRFVWSLLLVYSCVNKNINVDIEKLKCICKEYICFIENCAQNLKMWRKKWLLRIYWLNCFNTVLQRRCYYHLWFLHFALWSLYKSHHICHRMLGSFICVLN